VAHVRILAAIAWLVIEWLLSGLIAWILRGIA